MLTVIDWYSIKAIDFPSVLWISTTNMIFTLNLDGGGCVLAVFACCLPLSLADILDSDFSMILACSYSSFHVWLKPYPYYSITS